MNEETRPGDAAWWDARYRAGTTPWDKGTVAPEVIEFARQHPGRNAWAVDIGCGTGTHGRELARNDYRVVALDLSFVAIQKARDAARREGLAWFGVQGSASQLDLFQVELAAALDVGCFHGLSQADQLAYAKALDRRLTEGGYYLLYAAHPRPAGEVGGPPGVDPDVILEIFGARFHLLERQPGFHGQRGSDWWIWRKEAK